MTKEQLLELLDNTVTYTPQLRQHYLGNWRLGNKWLRQICSVQIDGYDELSKKEQRKLIDDMFIKLRVNINE